LGILVTRPTKSPLALGDHRYICAKNSGVGVGPFL
jgi:hypothetical protein